jgi:hypothetical protein
MTMLPFYQLRRRTILSTIRDKGLTIKYLTITLANALECNREAMGGDAL